MLIHHYTNIESLAMILSTKKIRFNRLDRVDDLEEGRVEAQGVPLGKYTYVSCWTEDKEESIPLWKMYTDNGIGVRISLPQDMFKDYMFLGGLMGVEVSVDTQHINPAQTQFLWKIPGSEYKGKNYLVIPVESNKPATFYYKIQYVDDVMLATKEQVEKLLNDDIDYNMDLGKVGIFKHLRWEFEKESRFILRIIPTSEEISLFDVQKFLKLVKEAFATKLPPHFETYDLSLKDGIFDNLVVTLSPSITDGRRVIVESLVKQYAPKATIKESTLRQSVKLK